ncbi:MAG TPA: glycosyl hydrolase family 8 [Polyangiaceae bacterium]|nr:glycosyl hydrolase family 8 [Polyangiaceae bacterium]
MFSRPKLFSFVALASISSACWHTASQSGDDATGTGGTSPAMGGQAAIGGSAGTGGTATVVAGTGGSVGGASGKGGTGGTGAGSGGTGAAGAPGGTGGTGTAGTGTAGMAASAGGGAAPMLMRGPTPASSTSKFPFPQNRQSSGCAYPTAYDNADVKNVYMAWKNDLVTSDGAGGNLRVKRPAEPGLQQNSTVSEGIGYGMLIAVYMDDQATFDGLWKYELAHTWQSCPVGGGGCTQTSLMNWYIASDGTVATQSSAGEDGTGAATDADEDMAFALVMADKQWGGQGSLSKSYLDSAKQLLGDIWKYEIDNNRLPKTGSSWGGDATLNISYFAPAYYRVFATVTGESRWGKDVVDYIYQVIGQNLTDMNGNKTNGLVPAFSNSTGGPAQASPGQSLAFNYQYDSCRTPFRIGLDACWTSEPRALDYVAKTSGFFGGIGAAKIVDGYQLNGMPQPQYPDKYNGLSAAFIGPAAVGAMSSTANQSFIDDAWGMLKQNDMWCGGQYYDESWTMMSMLMLSGNFLDYTKY